MPVLIAIYLYITAIVLLAVMIRQHHTGQCPLLSIRNVALVGFIVFQVTSGAMALTTTGFGHFYVSDPELTGLLFAVQVTVFLILLLWAYRHGFIVKRVATWVPQTWSVPSDGTLLMLSVMSTFIAAALRLTVGIPLISIITDYWGVGMAAVSSGLCGWVWGKRLMNPVVIFWSLSLMMVNVAIVITGAFGRRGIVAVGGCLVWGMFYSAWRHLPTRQLLFRLAIVTAIPLFVLAAFTSVRSAAEKDRSATEHLLSVRRGGDVMLGMLKMLDGQQAGAVSMWLMETYPERREFRHLFTPGYFVVYPVPRSWWRDKPDPLSTRIAGYAHIPDVDTSKLTIGPGIIGHANAEGGWYALLLYAILAGLIFRLLDEIVALNQFSPFIILPIGSALGQIIGLARGETSAFGYIALITIVTVYFTMLYLGKLFERFGAVPGFLENATADDGQYVNEAYDEELALAQQQSA